MAGRSLKPLLFAIHDAVMALAPRGWTRLELDITSAAQGLRLAELRSRGDGATTPRPPAPLNLSPQEEAAQLGDALTELSQELGGRWTPGQVVLERQATGDLDLRLLGADGSLAWFNRIEKAEIGTLLVTDALMDLVSGTARAFEHLQASFAGVSEGVTGFAYDAGARMLRLDSPAGSTERVAEVLGVYLSAPLAWMWSWSDEATPELATRGARRICDPDHRPYGLSALWRPSYHCPEGFAWAVCGSVAVSLGARGLFRAGLPDGSGALLFAVLE